MTHRFQHLHEEPYRLFFPLGLLAGVAGTSHWLLYTSGVLTEFSSVFHSSVQMQVYAALFIFGFLMTAGPRFAGGVPASGLEVGFVGLLFLLQFTCLAFQRWIAADLIFAALAASLALFMVRRVLGGPYRPPAEFVWIPIGLLCAITGSLLSVAARLDGIGAEWLAPGKLIKEQGFVLCIVLGVGGFLGPRLLGFPSLMNPAQLRSMADAQKQRRRRMMVHGLAGAGLVASFFIEGREHLRAAYSLRALIVGFEIFWTTSAWRLPVSRQLFSWLLWHSLWSVVLGFAACAAWPLHRKALLHISYIGGFSLMILAVATMVVFNHAGEADKLRKPFWTLRLASACLFLALSFRISASFFPEQYFAHIAVAAALWLAGGLVWLYLIAPRLVRRIETESDSC